MTHEGHRGGQNKMRFWGEKMADFGHFSPSDWGESGGGAEPSMGGPCPHASPHAAIAGMKISSWKAGTSLYFPHRMHGFVPHSVSNRHKFQRAFWARGLKSLRALTNVRGHKGNNLHLKAYKINAWILLISSASMCNVYPEFLRAFGPIQLAFQRALLNF